MLAAYLAYGTQTGLPELGGWLVAVLVTQLLPVPILRNSQFELLRMEEAVVLPMMLALSPFDALALVAAGVALSHAFNRAPLRKTVFNIANLALSTAACMAVVLLVAGAQPGLTPRGALGAMLGVAAMFAVNRLLVGGVMSLTGALRVREYVLQDLSLTTSMFLSNASVGLLLAVPYFAAPWLLVLAVVPLIMLHASYRALVRNATHDEKLQKLREHGKAFTQNMAVDRVALHLVRSARELIGADLAYLVVRDDAVVYLSDRNGDGMMSMREAEARIPSRGSHTGMELSVAGRRELTGTLCVQTPDHFGPHRAMIDENDRVLLMMLAHQAEAALENALLYQRELVLSNAGDGILGIDESGHVSFANPAAERMLGCSNADIMGMPHEVMHHNPEGRCTDETCNIVRAVTRGDARQTTRGHLRRMDGHAFPVEYTITPMRDDRGVSGSVLVFKDITERRHVERMKDEFVATVSHELRTPLTSLRGALGLLAGGVAGPVPEAAQRMLDIAVLNTDRLVRLTNDILDFERMESGRLELVTDNVSVAELMTHAVDVMRGKAHEHQVRLLSVPFDVWVVADADRVVQTLANLLSNAINFSERSATVWLTAEYFNGQVLFKVRDEGRGIPEHMLDSIFDRFQQVDASDTRERGGSGLGLAICQSIVQQHGGRIWVESHVGAGSTFLFTLPLGAASERTPQVTTKRRFVREQPTLPKRLQTGAADELATVGAADEAPAAD